MRAWIFAISGGIIGGLIVEYGDVSVISWQFVGALMIGLLVYKFAGRIIGL